MSIKKFLAVLVALSALVGVAQAGQDTLLASAARTATTSTSDIVRTSEQAIHIALIVTAVPTTETLTAKIEGKTISGTYYTLVAGTASAATGTVILKVGRGIASVTNVAIGDMLPDIYRVTITHSSTGSFTYSVERSTSQ